MHRANRLLGNAAGLPVLESVAGGLQLQSVGDTVVAVTGATGPLTVRNRAGAAWAAARNAAVALNDGDVLQLGATLAAVSMASIGLMLAYGDDDDWKKREDWDRDNSWWFKIGDKAYRIPKPFEIGAIGTIAERSLELMISDEMTGKRFGQRMRDLFMQNLSMKNSHQY